MAKSENNFDKEALNCQAWLYASEELEGADARGFELRLGEDQAARDALGQAAHMLGALESLPAVRPDSGYRQRVHAQLLESPGFWQRLFALRPYRGHPLMWGMTGAFASLFLFIGLRQVWQGPEIGKNGAAVVDRNPPLSTGPNETNRYASLAEAADIWAAMHPSDHLHKAHDDDARRRTRALDRARLLKTDDRRSKSESTPKPL
jgi:hypothetical protein